MKVILLDEPTRGIDVGRNTKSITSSMNWQIVVWRSCSPPAICPKVLGVADRIVVMREGEIAGELLHEQANEQQALSLAMPKVSGLSPGKESMMSSVTTSGAPKSAFSFGRIWDQYGMLVVFAALFVACAIFVPNFATFINMKGLGLAISMSGMVACGMLFCTASGDFDLSVASVIACAGVTTAVVINMTESLWIGVLAGLLLGVLSGFGERVCHCAPED